MNPLGVQMGVQTQIPLRKYNYYNGMKQQFASHSLRQFDFPEEKLT